MENKELDGLLDAVQVMLGAGLLLINADPVNIGHLYHLVRAAAALESAFEKFTGSKADPKEMVRCYMRNYANDPNTTDFARHMVEHVLKDIEEKNDELDTNVWNLDFLDDLE